jgi:hypothetical protein
MVMNDFFEKTLEDMIYENRDSIKDKGLDIFYKNTIRQFEITANKFDMFTWEIVEDTLFCRIIELKRDKLTYDNVFQILEYNAILMCAMFGYFKIIKMELILIGSVIPSQIVNITHISNIFRLFKYDYTINGIKFTEHGKKYDVVNEMVLNLVKDEDYEDIYSIIIS